MGTSGSVQCWTERGDFPDDVHHQRDEANTFTGDEHLAGCGDRGDGADHGAECAAGLVDNPAGNRMFFDGE